MQTAAWSVLALVSRLTLGLVFAFSGWAKLHNLEAMTGYFQKLGIPWPSLQAPVVAGVELVGGALLVVGALTRWASVLLLAIMVVAICTAKRADIEDWSDLLALSEFLFGLLLLQLWWLGAGRWSLDARRSGRRTRTIGIPAA